MGVEQVFIFIVMGITFALITIFGYKAVQDFLHQGEQVEFVRFKNELESSVKRIYTEFGSVQVKEFYLPSRYHQICFVDLDYQFTAPEQEELCRWDQIACTIWEQVQSSSMGEERGAAVAEENVFLTPPGPVPIKVTVIHLGPPGFLCQPLENGRFPLRLEGRGSYTLLSAVTS